MEIRRIEERDIDDFLSLWASIYDEGEFIFRKPPPKERVQSIVTKVVELEIPNYVALLQGQLVGSAEVFPTGLYELNVPDPEKLGILGILVRCGYRGRGIGRQLMDKLIEGSIRYGYHGIELDVCGSNQKAIRLYELYGFKWSADGNEVVLPSGNRTRIQKMYLELNAKN